MDQAGIDTTTMDVLRQGLADLRNGNGSIIALSGESGFGKTHVLLSFLNELSDKKSGVWSVYIDSQPPIGKFQVGNIQPLLPFSRVMEKLLKDPSKTPKNKLIKNIGMTILASMPLTGDIFYAVKEIGRDLRQFKRDKSQVESVENEGLTQDFYATICSYAEKNPLVLLMDDMHWSDAQSVELLNTFASEISSLPIMIVMSYQKSILQRKGVPLFSFIDMHINKSKACQGVKLKAIGAEKIRKIASSQLNGYKPNQEFEKWIMDKSFGVPGVVFEYMKYFRENPPFDKDGNLADDFYKSNFMPTSIQGAFSQLLAKLSEEERNILAVCSSEGREFTALIVSELLKTDVLTTIKKLRGLQNKTGIIKSQGAEVRYGVKTTKYRFTQGFYHSFFEKSLEYEEHIALHGQIASLLKKKYEEADSDFIREQIAPYLAAHSSESGDEETTKSMLLYSAKAANKYGGSEIIKSAYEDYVNIGKGAYGDEDGETGEMTESSPDDIVFREMARSAGSIEEDEKIITEDFDRDIETETGEPAKQEIAYTEFPTVRKALVKEYHSGNYESMADLAVSFKNGHKEDLTDSDSSQLLSFAAKAYIESGRLDEAEAYFGEGLLLAEKSDEKIAKCLALNTGAILKTAQGRPQEAFIYLEKAAKLAVSMPEEMRLITITNIALIMKDKSPENSRKYFKAAKQLSEGLDFTEFANEVFSV